MTLAIAGLLGMAPAAFAEPRASITAPATGGCVCPGVVINVNGSSFNTVAGNFVRDRLEYSRTPGTGGWTTIGSSTTPITTPGFLYAWNTAGLSPDVYALRLTTDGTDGSTTAFAQVTLQQSSIAAPEIVLRDAASPGSIAFATSACMTVSKVVGCAGLLTPTLEYRAIGEAVYSPLGATERDGYVEATLSIDPGTPAGEYEIRTTVQNSCGNTASTTKIVRLIDPAALNAGLALNLPPCGASTVGVLPIFGTATIPDLESWSLDWKQGAAGGHIASGTSSVINGPLGGWDTRGFAPCAYSLILTVRSQVLTSCGEDVLTLTHTRAVNVGCAADFNKNGSITVQDVFDFLAAFFSPCF